MNLSDKVLFVGNDINNANDNEGDDLYTWKGLLNDLKYELDPQDEIKLDFEKTPFPLVYQAFYVHGLKNGAVKKELDVKKKIQRLLNKIPSNPLHKKILELGFGHIVTTNFDLNFEEKSSKNASRTHEKKYSVFRKKEIDNSILWHIHGEQGVANSILSGHEGYGGYLEHMRLYMFKGRKFKEVEYGSLFNKLENNDIFKEIYSWMDLFFRKDIYVLGYSLLFDEIHLWWLLSLRSQIKNEKGLGINNTITYIHPSEYDPTKDPKLNLLKCLDVELKKFDYSNFENKREKIKYYNEALKWIREKGC